MLQLNYTCIHILQHLDLYASIPEIHFQELYQIKNCGHLTHKSCIQNLHLVCHVIMTRIIYRKLLQLQIDVHLHLLFYSRVDRPGYYINQESPALYNGGAVQTGTLQKVCLLLTEFHAYCFCLFNALFKIFTTSLIDKFIKISRILSRQLYTSVL